MRDGWTPDDDDGGGTCFLPSVEMAESAPESLGPGGRLGDETISQSALEASTGKRGAWEVSDWRSKATQKSHLIQSVDAVKGFWMLELAPPASPLERHRLRLLSRRNDLHSPRWEENIPFGRTLAFHAADDPL